MVHTDEESSEDDSQKSELRVQPEEGPAPSSSGLKVQEGDDSSEEDSQKSRLREEPVSLADRKDTASRSEMYERTKALLEKIEDEQTRNTALSALDTAETGDVDSQYYIGMELYSGNEIDPSYPEAAYWLTKAAENGHSDAQYWLGEIYEDGNGVEQSLTEAKKWYEKAAAQGHRFAIDSLRSVNYDLEKEAEEKKRMEEAELRPEMLPYEEICRRAEEGNVRCQAILGHKLTFKGLMNGDYTEALFWLRKASEAGDSDAQVDLGRMYEKGDGVPQSYADAATWYGMAAEQGDKYAIERLALVKGMISDKSPSDTEPGKPCLEIYRNLDQLFEGEDIDDLFSNTDRFIACIREVGLDLPILVALESSIRYAPDMLKNILQTTDRKSLDKKSEELSERLGLATEPASEAFWMMRDAYNRHIL